ncbi:MAG: glutathione S-transferase [Rhodobacteraceae bacterium]|jgi:glutathione S-transferase|nr:glutathione S-transferase [Paracoccaceae bacterium]
MQLYYSPTSPYVRKITVLIHEAGLADRVQRIPASGTPLEPGSLPLAENPLGKVPVLTTPHGTLYDSRVICRYLDDLAGAGAYPTGDALWRTLVLESTADGILDAALLMVYEARLRPEEMRYQPWVDAQWAKIARALDVLEADWMDHLTAPPLACPNIGHIALGAALGYVDFRLGAREWRLSRPALAQWADGFLARPSMQATVPPA